MTYFVIAVLTLYSVYQILVHFGVFESGVGANQLSEEVKEERKNNKKRRAEKVKLATFAKVTEYLHLLIYNKNIEVSHKYFIERLGIRSEVLGRAYSPQELRGKYASLLVIGVFCIPCGVFFSIFWVVAVVCFVGFFAYPAYYRQKIQDEDEIIDIYFIDLYLLMYSKLRMGSRARLQVTVESYIDTLKVSSNTTMKDTMMKLAQFLLNNLTMYEDHVAVPKLRERYKSATIVNFCNVASQALQGIDNADTLLTFKMDLVRRKTDMMIKNAEKLRIKGERSIYLIYVILFIIILVGWYSKLPTGFF